MYLLEYLLVVILSSSFVMKVAAYFKLLLQLLKVTSLKLCRKFFTHVF